LPIIRWGILGAAAIAANRVIPGMKKSSKASIDAIASRSRERAGALAQRYDIPKVYETYEDLLADKDIDAVYVPLPNHLHLTWSLKALQAGKHVLCEKPIALNAAQARQLSQAAKKHGCHILEAFMVRCHPQWKRVFDLVHTGRIGRVGLVQATISYFLSDRTNYRFSAEMGGGGLYDIGCYATFIAYQIFEQKPKKVIAHFDIDPAGGVDRLCSAIVDFGEGRQLVFSCATQLAQHQRFQIFGTQARIEIPLALNASASKPMYIFIDEGALDGSELKKEEFEICDQYQLQADEAASVFSNNTSSKFSFEDSIINMEIIDAIFRSGRSQEWEEI
jgi:predicted dehydrogenase